MRVHTNLIPDGKLHPGVFREHGGSISVDWEKYSTPQQSRARARVPNDNGILALKAGVVRAVEDLTVSHSPKAANRAHSEIKGLLYADTPEKVNERKTRIRAKLFDHARDLLIVPG